MLALRAPSAWHASQTIQRAASTVASSVANAAVQARSRMPRSRNAASSSTTSRSPSRWATPDRRARRSAAEAATCGMRRALLRARPDGSRRPSARRGRAGAAVRRGGDDRACGAVRRRAGSRAGATRRRSDVGLVTISRTIATMRTVRSIPPRWSFFPVAMSSGGGPAGAPAGGGGRWSARPSARPPAPGPTIAKTIAMRYRTIPMTSQR